VAEVITFANGLRADLEAVRAGLECEWSNRQVEGHVHRLKLVKRQMYGQAKLDLLRARVLYAA
jgi:transposase